MPFTFSHPAVVLPLNYLPKRWFSLTSLVIGSMIPDFEYFIRMRSGSFFSHTWLGLFWYDLPLALLVIWIYNRWVKNVLIDHLPAFFNRRLSIFKNSVNPPLTHPWYIIAISILVGGATHITWDSFTHWGGYFAMHIPIITTWVEVGNHGIPVFAILQLLSSVLGALAILIVICRLPEGEFTGTGHFIFYWMKIIAIAIPIVLIRFHNVVRPWEIEDLIDATISAMLIGLIIVSVIQPRKQIKAI